MEINRHTIVSLMLLVVLCMLIGCTSPRVNIVRNQTLTGTSIRTIALMPSGGVMADAIGLELLSYGFNVVDTGKITSLMVRDNLNEIEITQPQNLSRLSAEGIDAIILVKSVAGYDGRPQSASVKIVQTTNGQLLAGANWQNGRAGVQDSWADQDARVDLAVAAKQIADALGPALQTGPNR